MRFPSGSGNGSSLTQRPNDGTIKADDTQNIAHCSRAMFGDIGRPERMEGATDGASSGQS